MDEKKLRQLFKNKSNCYVDAYDIVLAMDEDCFVETVKEVLRLSAVTPSLHSEPKTKDDMLLEILAPLGTEIPDPTGEYADLFAYLYDKISPLLSNVLSSGWIPVEKQLPEFEKPVLILTDYGKMDVCRLRLKDNQVIVWVNDMRPQHTNGNVIAWIALPACT